MRIAVITGTSSPGSLYHTYSPADNQRYPKVILLTPNADRFKLIVMSLEESLRGTYVLLLHLPVEKIITVGKLGAFDFPAGWYTYIGSAFGSGGLLGRIKHHLQPPENPHWHIDYLRREAQLQEIWLSPDTERREEDWVDLMIDIPDAVAFIGGFGASDSRQDTHLFYFHVRPSLADFAVGVRARFPEAKVLRAYTKDE